MTDKNNDKQRLIDLLKKLFAMGSSDNQHEAEVALAKANQIMQEHQIGMTDIDLSGDDAVVTCDLSTNESKQNVFWIMCLAEASALLYGGRSSRFKDCFGGITLTFYGTGNDIEAAKMTFQYLLNSWKSIVSIDIRGIKNKRGYKNSHGRGYALSILKRVKTLVAERNFAVKSATGRDLVLIKTQAVDAALTGIKTQKPSTAAIDISGYRAGALRGDAIPLGGAIRHDDDCLQITKQEGAA